MSQLPIYARPYKGVPYQVRKALYEKMAQLKGRVPDSYQKRAAQAVSAHYGLSELLLRNCACMYLLPRCPMHQPPIPFSDNLARRKRRAADEDANHSVASGSADLNSGDRQDGDLVALDVDADVDANDDEGISPLDVDDAPMIEPEDDMVDLLQGDDDVPGNEDVLPAPVRYGMSFPHFLLPFHPTGQPISP